MYRSVICHIHSSFDGRASISGYCYEASRFGIDAVWLSDHDTEIIGMSNASLYAYDFSRATLTPLLNEHGHVANDCFEEADVNPACEWKAIAQTNEERILITTRGNALEWRGGTIRLGSTWDPWRKKRIWHPLFTEPKITICLETDILRTDPDARLRMTCWLSQAPPDHKTGSLQYVWGGLGRLCDRQLPLGLDNGAAEINLKDDCIAVGIGCDHTLLGLSFGLECRNDRRATAALTGLRVESLARDPGELQALQCKLAREVGKEYGIAVFCGHEYSDGEQHTNYYGPTSAVYPYVRGDTPALVALRVHAEANGGIVSLNHPFSGWKRCTLTSSERRGIVDAVAANLLRRRAAGIKLLEVGFPEGRDGFGLVEHLRLWDTLNKNALRIAGIAASDAHNNVPWDTVRNFANYVCVDGCTAADFASGMRQQNFYMADPSVCLEGFDFATSDGNRMGEQQYGGQATLTFSRIPSASKLVWVMDGEVVRAEHASGDHQSTLDLSGGKEFVRAELYRADGRIILLTNPIWLVS